VRSSELYRRPKSIQAKAEMESRHGEKVPKRLVEETNGLVLSIFSGAGGMDIGLEAAGLRNIGYLENDQDCLATLERNRPTWRKLEPHDATDAAKLIRPSDLGIRPKQLDVIAAGPPCQPFSSAAQWHTSGRQGMADSRSVTIRSLLRFTESFLPKVLLIENVVGFLRDDDGAITVLDRGLSRINRAHRTSYSLHSVVIDSADYGVPQHRRRAILVASRSGKQFVTPPTTHDLKPLTAWDAIGNLSKPDGEVLSLGTWARDLLASIPEGGNYQWLTSQGGGEELFGYRTRFWSFLLKLARDRPSWTLAASAGPSTGPFHWDNRQLTVRERMRLQTFPDDWILIGPVRSQIRMVGNATPPLLAEVVGRAIVQQFLNSKAEFKGSPQLLGRRRRSIPLAKEPIPVPSRLSHLIGDKPRHPGPGHGPSPRGATASA
jgi:DNA (cytosine-5)-methyltransferase 1